MDLLRNNLKSLYALLDIVNADIILTENFLQSHIDSQGFDGEFDKEISELKEVIFRANKFKNVLEGKISHILEYENSLIQSFSVTNCIFIKYPVDTE